MNRTTLSTLPALALVLALVAGCSASGGEDDERKTGKPERNDESIQFGKGVFEKNCEKCHGKEGKGDGPSRGLSVPKPRDFTKKHFKYVSTANGVPTEDDLFGVVSRGISGTQMAAMEGTLTDYERWAAVYYVQRLAGIENDTPVPLKVPPAPAGADAKAGEKLFIMHCSKCHGVKGEGDGVAVGTLKDDHGDLITPRNLVTEAMRGGDSPEALYARMKIGIPGTPMVPPEGYPVLSDAEIWKLVQFLLDLRQSRGE